MVRPFAARDVRTLRALDGIDFEVRQGEFFGIVGRNGSGKSTLLKLLASIYRADAGTIRLAGRLAPFIELGVGFNPELTARENVVLNGVMMGLTPKETRAKLDSVIEFAELEEFVDLKLKNYSSGMQVRLAFSVMLEADADVLLIDEVLAVGDAAFQQKCADAFHEMKSQGKTIVLVTHEMASVEEYCHRAMLIDDGKIRHIGDPAEVGRHYLQLNFERGSPEDHATVQAQPGDEVNLVDIWLEDEAGERISNVEHGAQLQPLRGAGDAAADGGPRGQLRDRQRGGHPDRRLRPDAACRRRGAALRRGPAGDGAGRDREPADGGTLLRPPRRHPRGRARASPSTSTAPPTSPSSAARRPPA